MLTLLASLCIELTCVGLTFSVHQSPILPLSLLSCRHHGGCLLPQTQLWLKWELTLQVQTKQTVHYVELPGFCTVGFWVENGAFSWQLLLQLRWKPEGKQLIDWGGVERSDGYPDKALDRSPPVCIVWHLTGKHPVFSACFSFVALNKSWFMSLFQVVRQ